MKRSDKEKILIDSTFAAKRLLGAYLIRQIDKHRLIGKIVETEVYHQDDPASHSCHGRTKRCEIMFGTPGFSYIYLVYGMYYCLNIVTGKEGEGAAVLIRALEPIKGIDTMKIYRKMDDIKNLTNGPGKVCQALNITNKENKKYLLDNKSSFYIKFNNQIQDNKIIYTTRIGISKAKDMLMRFYVKDSKYVSIK